MSRKDGCAVNKDLIIHLIAMHDTSDGHTV